MWRSRNHSDSTASLEADEKVLQREDSVMLAKDRLRHANDSITVAQGRQIRKIVDETAMDISQPQIPSKGFSQLPATATVPENPSYAETYNQNDTATGKDAKREGLPGTSVRKASFGKVRFAEEARQATSTSQL